MGHIKWTYEKCYEEAKKYTYKKQMATFSSKAYYAAKRNNWLNDYVWMKKPSPSNKKWDYETTKKEAQKYIYKKDFQTKSLGAYSAAFKHGWLKDYTWFQKPSVYNKKWTYEICRKEAEKYSYLRDFEQKSKGAAIASRKNRWINDFTWLKRKTLPKGYWNNYVNCYKEAQKYVTISNFSKCNATAYRASCKNNWLKDYTWLHVKKKIWSKEECFSIAKNYQTKKLFKTNEPRAYDAAKRHGWIKEMTWFIPHILLKKDLKAKIYSVYEYIDNEINAVYVGLTNNLKNRDYDHHGCTDKVAIFFKEKKRPIPKIHVLKTNLTALESQYYEDIFTKKYKTKGLFIINNGTTGILSSSLGGGIELYTYDYVKKIAQKYTSKKQFMNGDINCYKKAVKNKWINNFTWLKNDTKHIWTYEECYNIAKKYEYKIDFQLKEVRAFTSAYKHKWIKDYTWLKYKYRNRCK